MTGFRGPKTRDPGSDMRTGHRLRGHITGVPMVLMPGVQNMSQVRLDMRANHGGAVHHAGDSFEALTDFDVIDSRINCRECANHFFDGRAHFKRMIAFGIEVIGGRHSARHPNQNASIRRGLRMFDRFPIRGGKELRFPRHPSRCGAGGDLFQKTTTGDLCLL